MMRRSIGVSGLSEAITSDNWDKVVQICQTKPSAAQTWTTRQGLFEGIKDANVLPIHEALVAGAPLHVIEALLSAYPDSVYCMESSYKRLPLHCACRKNAIPEVVEILMTRYADAALTADNLGRLPGMSFVVVIVWRGKWLLIFDYSSDGEYSPLRALEWGRREGDQSDPKNQTKQRKRF